MLKIQKISRRGRLVYLLYICTTIFICIAGFYGVKAANNRQIKVSKPNIIARKNTPSTESTLNQQTGTNTAKPPASSQSSNATKQNSTPSKSAAVISQPAPSQSPVITPPVVAPSYDATILADSPVGYWTLSEGSSAAHDKTANNITGTYYGGTSKTTMPNQDNATVFSGASNTYTEIPDSDNYSITTTKKLTWEAWIRPDNINFVNGTKGYINWMGKCHVLSPTCEWMARFYNLVNTQNRCNRFSAYAFNPTASFGSGAYWQPTCGLIIASHWMHVVGEYQTLTTPSVCNAAYPGTIDIWVNGIKWDQSYAATTGCMSEYSIIPVNNNSPIDIGTVSKDSWYQGAVGKLAIYNYQLSQSQITSHYKTMTGNNPSGSCTSNCTLTNP